MKKNIKTIFLTGLAVAVPIGLTIYIFIVLIHAIDSFFLAVLKEFRPIQLIGIHIPGLGIIFTLILIFLAGLVTRSYLGNKLIQLSEAALNQIPLVSSVFKALKQVVNSTLGDKSSSFRQAGLVEFPRPGVYMVGFITNTSNNSLQRSDGKKFLNVFIPTTPNPTSGFFVMIPEDDFQPLNITVEEAFVLMMSAGIVCPAGWNPPMPTPVAHKNQ